MREFDEDDLWEARVLASEIRQRQNHDQGDCGVYCTHCDEEE